MTTFIAVGVAIGAAFGNIPVCMCVGAVIGAVLDGLAYASKKRATTSINRDTDHRENAGGGAS
jgi:large-conductance mechanosensitive channel